jgi:hypothetical protein
MHIFLFILREKIYHISDLHFTLKIQNKLGRMGLRPGPTRSHLFLLFFEAGSNPNHLDGLDPAGPTWLLVQTSDLVGHCCRRA